jgi:hypothetical protein
MEISEGKRQGNGYLIGYLLKNPQNFGVYGHPDV